LEAAGLYYSQQIWVQVDLGNMREACLSSVSLDLCGVWVIHTLVEDCCSWAAVILRRLPGIGPVLRCAPCAAERCQQRSVTGLVLC